ncbi:MAG: DUF2851 family protein [Bacteroidota bacterium]
MIREEFLHFLWKYNLFDPEYLYYKNQKIEVVDTGQHNMSSGPDFFNARIRIGETLWAGNVEIHVKASDWFVHNHESDPAYDNIILHLVYDPDIAVYRNNGEEIPFARLAFHPRLIKKYQELITEKEDRKCYSFFSKTDGVFYQDWIGKLGINRIERRVGELRCDLEETDFDWEETLYRLLAAAFGTKQNRDPFILLARAVPLKFVYKYRENPVVLNAAFFGQAGFLDETLTDDHYYSKLQKEYNIQRLNLPEALPGKHLWKLMRARPPAFPSVRIPQFIQMVKQIFPFVENLKRLRTAKELRNYMKNAVSNYWTEHFLYGQSGRRKEYIPSTATCNLWILNAIIPFIFTFGKIRNQEEFMQLSLKLLEELPAENNEILKKWNKFGVIAKSAFDSQALIELKTRFCDMERCTECMIGHKILLDAEKKRQNEKTGRKA